MTKTNEILRSPDLAMSVSSPAGDILPKNRTVATIHVREIQRTKDLPDVYTCDLLDSQGDILKAGHEWTRGKQPFKDLTDGEISSLTPKKKSDSTPDKEPVNDQA